MVSNSLARPVRPFARPPFCRSPAFFVGRFVGQSVGRPPFCLFFFNYKNKEEKKKRMHEQWNNVIKELVLNKCSYCNELKPLKTHYIKIKDDNNNVWYVINAFCSNCLEGFPWSTNLCDMFYVNKLPKHCTYDTVELMYH